VKRDHFDRKNELILRVSYYLVLCHWLNESSKNNIFYLKNVVLCSWAVVLSMGVPFLYFFQERKLVFLIYYQSF